MKMKIKTQRHGDTEFFINLRIKTLCLRVSVFILIILLGGQPHLLISAILTSEILAFPE